MSRRWLSIRRAVADELEAEVYSSHSETSDSFYSDSDYSELDAELAEREAALTIQAEVRDWMRTKHAASVIQRNVRTWLDLQEPDAAVDTAMQLSRKQQQSRVTALSSAPASGGAASTTPASATVAERSVINSTEIQLMATDATGSAPPPIRMHTLSPTAMAPYSASEENMR